MQHVTLKALAPVATDEGIFEAVISTAAIDRENDVVVPAALVKALRAWTSTGKVIPLAWGHGTNPEDIIGHIDPETVNAMGDEVIAEGQVDLDTDRGQQVWRLMKSNSLGFSFGYLITDSHERPDGIREIRGLDVFEVSATPTPMNAGTRVVSTKALDPDHRERIRSETCQWMSNLLASVGPAEDLKEKSLRLAREAAPPKVASFPVE